MTDFDRNLRRRVVGVVGLSGAGKTSLLERLIPVLRERGLRVGAVKHASHGFLADRPGKDSYRVYESGAEAVALISREQLATFVRRDTPENEEVSLDRALQALPQDLDLVIVEGFSWEAIPRIVLEASSTEPSQGRLAQGEVLQVVSVPEAPPGEKPAYAADLVQALANLIVERVANGGEPSVDPTGIRGPASPLS